MIEAKRGNRDKDHHPVRDKGTMIEIMREIMKGIMRGIETEIWLMK